MQYYTIWPQIVRQHHTVNKPEQCDQIVHCVFCLTFMKFYQIHCEITNNILQISLPNFANFFSFNNLL